MAVLLLCCPGKMELRDVSSFYHKQTHVLFRRCHKWLTGVQSAKRNEPSGCDKASSLEVMAPAMIKGGENQNQTSDLMVPWPCYKKSKLANLCPCMRHPHTFMPSLAIHNSSSSFSGFIPSHLAYSITSARPWSSSKKRPRMRFSPTFGRSVAYLAWLVQSFPAGPRPFVSSTNQISDSVNFKKLWSHVNKGTRGTTRYQISCGISREWCCASGWAPLCSFGSTTFLTVPD